MLFASLVFYALAALWPFAAVAHPVKEAVVPGIPVVLEKAVDVDTQQRRALLRALLKSQATTALDREGAHAAPSPMSAQKRADLRQQLRQQ